MVVSAIDFPKTEVLPVYGQFNITLYRILTDNGKEYATHWANDKHAYETFLKQNNIKHTKLNREHRKIMT